MMQECAALSTVYNVANAHGVRLVCRVFLTLATAPENMYAVVY